jgi:4-diphosphocytidyl-2-C-methyl-D-erythritol kinase
LYLLAGQANDLEAPAIVLQPVVAEVLTELRGLSGCTLARMSGSGATCFGLFADVDAAVAAEKRLSARHANWWVKETTLGG